MKRIVIVVLSLLAVVLIPLAAQSNEIILTIAIQEWMQDTFNEELFAQFEEDHPGVKVVTVILPQDAQYYSGAFSSTEEDINNYMESVENLAARADVIPTDSYSYDMFSTRTGYFLDLNPLLSADPHAELEDFYPALLNSFRWDGGTWALPMSGMIETVIYKPSAFDENNLPYPDASWTVNDYYEVGRALTQYDNSGEVTTPGFFGFDSRILLRAAVGHPLIDETTFPPEPRLDDPALAEAVLAWAEFDAATTPNFENGPGPEFDFDAVPMTITGTWRLEMAMRGSQNADSAASLLPGGTSLVRAQGYAISAGTQYPEEAYALLQWMTRSPEVSLRFYGDTTARRSLRGLSSDSPSAFTPPQRGPEVQALIDEALEVAFPSSDLFFYNYGYTVISKVRDEGMDVETALRETEQEAIDLLEAIGARAAQQSIVVATPVPTPVLQAGEISLTFGIQTYIYPVPNRENWDAAIEEFLLQDPEVRQILLDTEFAFFDDRVEQQDCFYLPSNIVPSVPVGSLLAVDPFLSADPNFDPDEIVPGAMDQLTINGAVYGVPFALQPHVMWYDAARFQEMGVAEPFSGWNVSDFERVLRDYRAASGGISPYKSRSFDNMYLLLLMAAYGGQPIDFSSGLFTFHLTDSAVIQAAEQVLNLARDGYIDYSELVVTGAGGYGSGDAPLYDETLATSIFRLQNREFEDYQDTYRMVTFPIGLDIAPVSYDLGTIYISSQTPYPEACYRWISFLSNQPGLIDGMPARRSQIAAAAAAVPDGDDLLAVYEEYDRILHSPSVLVLPGAFTSTGGGMASAYSPLLNFLGTTWMNEAFDAYVLEDSDLAAELEQAQQFIGELQVCTAGIEPVDNDILMTDPEASEAYYSQFIDCAIAVDPDIELFLR